MKEFDDYDIENDVKNQSNWDSYKYDLENKIISKYIIEKKLYKNC